MSTPGLTNIPFAPYRLKRNDRGELVVEEELTLRDVVLHKYVRGAATWIMGYRANYPLAEQEQVKNSPLRPQQMESPHETAWTILLLLEIVDLLGQSHPELIHEIYHKIPDAVLWLLEKGREFSNKDEKKRTNWEDWYDTAIVIHSLLCTKQAGLLHKSMQNTLPLTIKQTLSLLGDTAFQQLSQPYKLTQRVNDDLAVNGGESLAVTLPMLFYASKVAQIDFIEVFGRSHNKLHPVVLSLLDNIVTFVEQAFERAIHSTTPHLYLPIHFDLLIALADILIENDIQKLGLSIEKVSAIRILLVQGIEMLEGLILKEDFQIDTSTRVDRLTTYIRSLRALAITESRDKTELFGRSDLILGQLRNIIDAVDPFGDGSTYHNTPATRHSLRCFLEVCRWSEANRKIVELYDDHLKISLHAYDERKQFFQLQMRLIETERNRADEKEQYERDPTNVKEQHKKSLMRESNKGLVYLVFAIAELIAAILISVSRFFSLSDLFQVAGLSVGALGIIVALIAVVRPRES